MATGKGLSLLSGLDYPRGVRALRRSSALAVQLKATGGAGGTTCCTTITRLRCGSSILVKPGARSAVDEARMTDILSRHLSTGRSWLCPNMMIGRNEVDLMAFSKTGLATEWEIKCSLA